MSRVMRAAVLNEGECDGRGDDGGGSQEERVVVIKKRAKKGDKRKEEKLIGKCRTISVKRLSWLGVHV